MKENILIGFAAIGSFISSLYGGWTSSITTLIIVILIDYFTGVITSLIFKKSIKTETGGYSSSIGFKGLCRKGLILLLVLVGHRLDLELGMNYIRDGICIGFILNEVISIIENASLIGLPIPDILSKSLDLLKNKENK